MSLIDELKERREAVANRLEDAYVSTGNLRAELDDLDRAIDGLKQPADAPIPDEQPELFEDEKVEALEQLETDHALPPSADDVVVEEAPQTVEEAPALNEAMQDEREQGYAPVTNPEADFWAQTLTEQPKPEPFRLASIFRREKEDA
jgi:hypothetical protein